MCADRARLCCSIGTRRHPRMTGSVLASRAMSGDPRHGLGAAGERLAAAHLERRGFEILERNYRTRWGELDLVAFDGRVLVFCEVKTRRAGGSRGGPLEAVRPSKQARVRRMASSWLRERGRERPYAPIVRCDAIGVTVDAGGRLVCLEHLEAAF
jgi:putative endonuclease